jgi:hypothetical protein
MDRYRALLARGAQLVRESRPAVAAFQVAITQRHAAMAKAHGTLRRAQAAIDSSNLLLQRARLRVER